MQSLRAEMSQPNERIVTSKSQTMETECGESFSFRDFGGSDAKPRQSGLQTCRKFQSGL